MRTWTWPYWDLKHMLSQNLLFRPGCTNSSAQFNLNMPTLVCHVKGRSLKLHDTIPFAAHVPYGRPQLHVLAFAWSRVHKGWKHGMCFLERMWVGAGISGEVSLCVRERRIWALLYSCKLHQVTSGDIHTCKRTCTHTENCNVTIRGKRSDETQHLIAVKSAQPYIQTQNTHHSSLFAQFPLLFSLIILLFSSILYFKQLQFHQYFQLIPIFMFCHG